MRRHAQHPVRPQLVASLAAAVLLSACGQAGPLYLPDAGRTTSPTPLPTATPAASVAPTTPAATAAPQTP